jgi:hypothetical protein
MEVDRKMTQLQISHQRSIVYAIQEAMFLRDNVSFVDWLTDQSTLVIRKFWNADGVTPPPSVTSGSAFASSHQHYNAISGSSPTSSELTALVKNVSEHDNTSVQIYINENDLPTIKALSGFTALQSPYLVAPTNVAVGVQTQDLTNIGNRILGVWNNTTLIRSKPWVPQNYVLAMDTTVDPKPLGFREMENPALRGLLLNTEGDLNIKTETGQAFFGLSVANRGSGAVLYISGSSWTDPTLS